MLDSTALRESLRGCPEPRGSAQRAALATVVAAMTDGAAFAAVTGASGTGKTVILDIVADRVGRPPIQIIRIAAAGEPLTSERLIDLIGAGAGDESDTTPIDRAQQQLLEPSAPYERTLLLVDDAHQLQPQALLYLQLTSQLQAGCMQIVFSGQPEFWTLLEEASLSGIRDRIAFRSILEEQILEEQCRPSTENPDLSEAERPGTALATLPQPDFSHTLALPRRRSVPRRAWHIGALAAFGAIVVFLWADPATREFGNTGISAIAKEFGMLGRPAIATRIDAASANRVVRSGPTDALPPIVAVGATPSEPPGPPPTAMLLASSNVGLSGPGGAAPPPVIERAPEPPAFAAPADAVPVVATTDVTTASPPLPEPTRVDQAYTAEVPREGQPPPAMSATATAGLAAMAPPDVKIASAVATEHAPAPPVATPDLALTPTQLDVLLRRGDESLGLGDIQAARLLFERAAASGSGEAALAMAKTFDPRFLAQFGANWILPDPAKAAEWYQRAAALGAIIPR
jgi:AAA domain